MFYHPLLICSIIFALFNPIFSDIYMHNPRGTNNRHNENTPERKNANLNFDSQNNNRGGYNVGDDGAIYYYAQSILPIEWTNQHSCNDVNSDCALLLQYTCDDTLRDGQTTTTIPVTDAGEKDPQYRLTESLSSYLYCRVRSRNKNLFTANQALQGNSAIYTRQNPAGTRYGYECPEERDYYPHWQPNDWIDIAVLTNRQDLCSYYRENSQNVQSRFACSFNTRANVITANQNGVVLPNTKEECETYNATNLNGLKPIWMEYPSHNLPPPECYAPSYTRENHLGDVLGSEMAVFNWTLPETPAKKCVLRIRYNISTADYDGWNTDSKSNGNNLLIMSQFFGNNSATANRGYIFQNDPQIQLFDGVDLKLQLAINTAQYSRVFEDRSFTFEIRARPAEYGDKPIYNLNVRGRRGNIVQVFPAVEYDFVPARLEIPPNSYVHIQWIGSNTTPPGAGQGTAQIDRNNFLMLKNIVLNPNWDPYEYLNSTGLLSGNLPENLTKTNFLYLPLNDLRQLATSGAQNPDPLLVNAKAYFDLGPRLITADSTGIYHYVSTRNNDFSNRDQKGQITVQPYQFQYELIGQNTYIATLDNAIIIFPAGCVQTSVSVKLAKYSVAELPTLAFENGQNIFTKEKLYGNVYVIEPYDLIFLKNIEFQIPFDEFGDNVKNVDVLQFKPRKGVYLKLPSSLDNANRTLRFQSDVGGVYVFIEKQTSPLWIAGIIIPVVLILIIVFTTIMYFRLRPEKLAKAKNRLAKTKRSMAPRI